MRQIFLIRLALILGVAMFAGLTVFQRTQGMIPDATDADTLDTLRTLRYAVWALSAFAIGWAFFFRARVDAAKTEQQIHQALILGWAPAEGTALLAVVQYFQGGALATMATGILTFAVVLLLLRVPDTRS